MNSFVAVKIIKNSPAFYQQALVEVSILTTVNLLWTWFFYFPDSVTNLRFSAYCFFTQLNKKFDPEDKHHIVRIYDYFVYQNHLCIVFELLDVNLWVICPQRCLFREKPFCLMTPGYLVALPWESCIRYELIKLNHFRGLSLSIVQLFSKQVIHFPCSKKVHSCHDCWFWSLCYKIDFFIILDIAGIGSYERCWHNSLWSKAREYSVMYKVSSSFMILVPKLFYISKVFKSWNWQYEASRNQNHRLRISLQRRSYCLLLYTGKHFSFLRFINLLIPSYQF